MTRSLSARIRSAILGAASLGALAALPSSCSTPSKPQARPSSGESGKSDARKLPPEIDFSEQPTYIPNDTLSLTFDDGPLPPFTTEVLDVLKQHGVHATFFINTENNGNDVPGTPGNKEIVRRIVNEGAPGWRSHTVHHLSLKTLTPAQIETEITGVEAVVRDIFGTPAARLTLLRSPYGEPYQDYFYDHGRPRRRDVPDGLVRRLEARCPRRLERRDRRLEMHDRRRGRADAGCVYGAFHDGGEDGRGSRCPVGNRAHALP